MYDHDAHSDFDDGYNEGWPDGFANGLCVGLVAMALVCLVIAWIAS